jgi:hypothetical protein
MGQRVQVFWKQGAQRWIVAGPTWIKEATEVRIVGLAVTKLSQTPHQVSPRAWIEVKALKIDFDPGDICVIWAV